MRHESLRTVFALSPGFTNPFQIVRPEPAYSWDVYDLTGTEECERDAALQSFTRPESWAAAPISSGPTFGVKVFRIGVRRHLLALRVFAICCDRSSIETWIIEIAELYAGHEAKEAPVQCAEYSEWHNQLLLAETPAAAGEFWSIPRPIQPLPFRRRVPLCGDMAEAIYVSRMDPALLRDIPQDPSVFLLGCWQALLCRLTNRDAVVVGSICNERPLPELRGSVGLFSRPLPIAVSFEDDPSFAQVFERIAENIHLATKWQSYYPAESAGPVGFDFQRVPDRITAGGLSVTAIECESPSWPFQLALSCRDAEGRLHLEHRYDPRQFSASDIERLAKYFERTVRAAVEDSSCRVFSFDLMDDDERRRVVVEFNSNSLEYLDSRPLHEIFEHQVLITPHRPALAFEENVLTYAELNARANRIANWLRKAGVGPNVGVGICLERSAGMVIGLLGILKAGGAYVPLLPELPPARLRHQIAEAGLGVVISALSLLERLRDFAGRVLCLDRDEAQLAQEDAANPPHTASLDDLIYVLYTSGSTGVPKGVATRHGNVANYTHGILNRLGLRELSDDQGLRFALMSTLGADLGNTSIYPPLVTGGCIEVISYEAALNGALYGQGNRRRPVDILKCAPSTLSALLASGNPSDILPRRSVIVGGESCSWDLVRRVGAAGTCAMWNHYGPTEVTIGCVTYPVGLQSDPAEAFATVVPLGRPIPNMQVYVLDEQLRPVPVGVPGEICISGAGLSKGYVGRPEETQTRFVPHPFLPDGGLLYRSGDLGRFLPDGTVEFLGREDDQVKIRGYRVELAEIESVLRQYPSVQQAVVLLSDDGAGRYLIAYLIATPEPSTTELRDHLRQHLPDYMMPRDFVFVQEFPLNANGKVDRRRLEQIKATAGVAGTEALAPRNELEERLLSVWKEVLDVKHFGVRDNFFDLGGDSLSAAHAVARFRAALRRNVTVRMLFAAPTVEALAEAIGTLPPEDEEAELASYLTELGGLAESDSKGRTNPEGVSPSNAAMLKV